jgi:hypothetical protein
MAKFEVTVILTVEAEDEDHAFSMVEFTLDNLVGDSVGGSILDAEVQEIDEVVCD